MRNHFQLPYYKQRLPHKGSHSSRVSWLPGQSAQESPKYVLLGFPKIQQKSQAGLSTSMMAGLLSSACNKACVPGVQGYLGLSGICRSDLDFSKNQILHITDLF